MHNDKFDQTISIYMDALEPPNKIAKTYVPFAFNELA